MSLRRPFSLKRLEAIGWIALVAFIAWRVWPQLAAAAGVGAAGAAAPAVEVETLEGDRVALRELRGRVVLVNFWATWCAPCRVEMPAFQSAYDRYRDAGFTIVGISTDARGASHVREFLRERGITYPVAMAGSGAARAFGGVHALPTSFLIDRRGRIRHTVRGYFAGPALESAVRKLLAEPADTAAGAEP